MNACVETICCASNTTSLAFPLPRLHNQWFFLSFHNNDSMATTIIRIRYEPTSSQEDEDSGDDIFAPQKGDTNAQYDFHFPSEVRLLADEHRRLDHAALLLAHKNSNDATFSCQGAVEDVGAANGHGSHLPPLQDEQPAGEEDDGAAFGGCCEITLCAARLSHGDTRALEKPPPPLSSYPPTTRAYKCPFTSFSQEAPSQGASRIIYFERRATSDIPSATSHQGRLRTQIAHLQAWGADCLTSGQPSLVRRLRRLNHFYLQSRCERTPPVASLKDMHDMHFFLDLFPFCIAERIAAELSFDNPHHHQKSPRETASVLRHLLLLPPTSNCANIANRALHALFDKFLQLMRFDLLSSSEWTCMSSAGEETSLSSATRENNKLFDELLPEVGARQALLAMLAPGKHQSSKPAPSSAALTPISCRQRAFHLLVSAALEILDHLEVTKEGGGCDATSSLGTRVLDHAHTALGWQAPKLMFGLLSTETPTAVPSALPSAWLTRRIPSLSTASIYIPTSFSLVPLYLLCLDPPGGGRSHHDVADGMRLTDRLVQLRLALDYEASIDISQAAKGIAQMSLSGATGEPHVDDEGGESEGGGTPLHWRILTTMMNLVQRASDCMLAGADVFFHYACISSIPAHRETLSSHLFETAVAFLVQLHDQLDSCSGTLAHLVDLYQEGAGVFLGDDIDSRFDSARCILPLDPQTLDHSLSYIVSSALHALLVGLPSMVGGIGPSPMPKSAGQPPPYLAASPIGSLACVLLRNSLLGGTVQGARNRHIPMTTALPATPSARPRGRKESQTSDWGGTHSQAASPQININRTTFCCSPLYLQPPSFIDYITQCGSALASLGLPLGANTGRARSRSRLSVTRGVSQADSAASSQRASSCFNTPRVGTKRERTSTTLSPLLEEVPAARPLLTQNANPLHPLRINNTVTPCSPQWVSRLFTALTSSHASGTLPSAVDDHKWECCLLTVASVWGTLATLQNHPTIQPRQQFTTTPDSASRTRSFPGGFLNPGSELSNMSHPKIVLALAGMLDETRCGFSAIMEVPNAIAAPASRPLRTSASTVSPRLTAAVCGTQHYK